MFVDGPYGGIDTEKFFGSDRLVVVAGGSGAGWILPFVEQFLRYLTTTNIPKSSTDEIQEIKQTSNEAQHQRSLPGPRSLRVILATRDAATRTWFHTALNELLSEHKSLGTPSELSIEVHLTGEASQIAHPSHKSALNLNRSTSSSTKEDDIEKHAAEPRTISTSTDATPEEEVCGRPDLPLIIRDEALAARGENVAVFVCGPVGMQDDARNAVAGENLRILRGNKREGGGGMYLHLEHFSWA